MAMYVIYLIVGLPYTIILGAVCALLIISRRKGLKYGGLLKLGHRMVLQYYLGKYG